MATNHNVENVELEETLGSAMTKTEQFFEENGKKIVYVIFGLLIIAACVFGYKLVVAEPRMAKSTDMISNAQTLFDQATPDYNAALNGDANGAGFLDVIDAYGSTPAGNIANHYAGVCYMKLGDFANAAKYLSQYKAVEGTPATIINAQNLGLQGDIAVENGDYKSAMALYAKAVTASQKNILTAPIYLRKGGLAAEAAGDKAAAKALFETIATDYPSSVEARDAEKYIGTLE